MRRVVGRLAKTPGAAPQRCKVTAFMLQIQHRVALCGQGAGEVPVAAQRSTAAVGVNDQWQR
jgi:hypothetical protein